MSKCQKIRPLKYIPVYIEEDHHEVLPHIYKHIGENFVFYIYNVFLVSGAKNLPLEHNTLIHFDSHPDLLLPSDLSPDEAYDKYQLFQKLSIENWILPGVFVGVFRTVVWVCPWWSNQIRPGEFSFQAWVYCIFFLNPLDCKIKAFFWLVTKKFNKCQIFKNILHYIKADLMVYLSDLGTYLPPIWKNILPM